MCQKESKPSSSGTTLEPNIIELLRQHADHQQWYDLNTIEKKLVEDACFVTSFTHSPSNQLSQKNLLNKRCQSHFIMMGLSCDQNHVRQIFSAIVNRFVEEWPDFYQNKFNNQIIEAVLQIQDIFGKFMKKGTYRFMYTFNIASVYRILHSIAIFDLRSKKMNNLEMAKLLMSEIYRTLLDRFIDKADRKIIHQNLL